MNTSTILSQKHMPGYSLLMGGKICEQQWMFTYVQGNNKVVGTSFL